MISESEKELSDFLGQQVVKLKGERLVAAVFRLIKGVVIYQSVNRLSLEGIADFKVVIREILESGAEATLLWSRGHFYLGGEKIPFTSKNFDLLNRTIDVFSRRGLSGLSFAEGVLQVPDKEIFRFFKVFQESEKEQCPEKLIREMLDSNSISWVDIHARSENEESSEKEPSAPQERAKKNYLYSITAVKEVCQKLTVNERAGVRKAKRLVQNIVDIVIEDEGIVLGLTTLKNYDNYTYNHSVNVAVLAICLGKRLGLERNSLRVLGICGLFHDLGKVLLPKEILHKRGQLDEEDWIEIRKHPLYSVGTILKLQASHELKAKIVLAPFEHHIRYDRTGYPKVEAKPDLSFFGRILAVADCYDAMTSARSYRPFPISPDQALSLMLEKAGKDFDPVILKVFIQMMGIFPVGTVIELDTGEKGLVLGKNPDPGMLSRPRVLLLFDEKGKRLSDRHVVDLCEKEKKNGQFKRTVKRAINPKEHDINPTEYLL